MPTKFGAVWITHDPLIGEGIQVDFHVLTRIAPSDMIGIGEQGDASIEFDFALKMKAAQIAPNAVEGPTFSVLRRVIGSRIVEQFREGLAARLSVRQALAFPLGVGCPGKSPFTVDRSGTTVWFSPVG